MKLVVIGERFEYALAYIDQFGVQTWALESVQIMNLCNTHIRITNYLTSRLAKHVIPRYNPNLFLLHSGKGLAAALLHRTEVGLMELCTPDHRANCLPIKFANRRRLHTCTHCCLGPRCISIAVQRMESLFLEGRPPCVCTQASDGKAFRVLQVKTIP